MKSFEEYLNLQYQQAEKKYRERSRRIAARHKTREERRLARRTAAGTAIISIICLLAATLILLVSSVRKPADAYLPETPSPDVSEAEVKQPVIEAVPLSVAPVVESPPVVVLMPSYTEQEVEILAIIIYQEAGGDACSNDTRLKVGTVFLNRVADPRYPDTFEEVALQYKQYGRLYWTGLVWPERASLPQEAHAVERAYECARRLLNGERFLPEDVIFQSEYIQGTEIVCEQDGFYFCR